ncbi:MAG: hypothetical protein RIQ33_2100, partial [Bacteroidota bacterium]
MYLNEVAFKTNFNQLNFLLMKTIQPKIKQSMVYFLLIFCFCMLANNTNAQNAAHASFTTSVMGNAVTLTNTSTYNSGALGAGYYVMDNGYSSFALSQISNPYTFTYTSAGLYNVCITVSDSATGDLDSICHPVQIGAFVPDTISGYVYDDVNANGVWDAGDLPIANHIVYMCHNSCPYTYTDASGHYQFLVAPNINNIYLYIGNGITTQPGQSNGNYYSQNSSATGGQLFSNNNFGIYTSQCNINASFTSSVSGTTISLTNTSTGLFNNSYWIIDGGTTYTTTNLSIPVNTAGLHYVYLISFNSLTGCYDSSIQQINVTISNADTISGYTYVDANGNGVKDVGESAIKGVSIILNDTTQNWQWVTTTDTTGFYQFIVANGSYYITVDTSFNYYYSFRNPSNNNYGPISFSAGLQDSSGNNFGAIMRPCPSISSIVASLQTKATYSFSSTISNPTWLTHYILDFGDGTTSANPNSTHTYLSNGIFIPILYLLDSVSVSCSDTFILSPIVISSITLCSGTSQFNTYSSCNQIYFYNQNQNSNTTFSWDLGDGTTNTGSSFWHNYSNIGNYIVQCISYNSINGCYDTTAQTITINSLGISASFTYTVTGNTVLFNNTSTGSITNYYWSFDDGGSSTLANPSHTFILGGQHNVYLSLTNTNNCNDSIFQTIFIPIPNADTLTGNVFDDSNNNGIRDVGEAGMPYHYVYLTSQGQSVYTQTNAVGDYQFILASGTDTINAPYIWQWNQTMPSNTYRYIVPHTGNQYLSGFDFGFNDTTSTISGHVYFDTNGNGAQDIGETNASYIRVDVYGNSMSTHVYTDINGNYTALLYYGNGNFNITCNPVLSNYINYNISTLPTQYNVTTIGATNHSGNDFGLHPISTTTGDNLMISFSPYSTIVPGYTGWYLVSVKNIGSTTVSGNVTCIYDPALTYSNANFGSNNASLHQLTWNVTNLSPGGVQQNTLWMTLNSSTLLGTILNHSATVSLTGSATDVDPSNNFVNYQQLVVGSFDPNMKSVSPVGVGSTGAVNPIATDELTYTIQFQNTGTAPAINIAVKDILDANFDLSTIQMLASSHPYILSIDDANRLATWKFENIMLADSTHDEPHSHGFIQY